MNLKIYLRGGLIGEQNSVDELTKTSAGKAESDASNSNIIQLSNGQVTFEWRLSQDTDDEEAIQLAESLKCNEGLVQVQHFQSDSENKLYKCIPVIIPVIFGITSIVMLVKNVADWLETRHKSGTLIQVGKDGKVNIQPLEIPYGNVMFVGADGKTFEYVDVSKDELKDIIEAVSRGIIPVGGDPKTNIT